MKGKDLLADYQSALLELLDSSLSPEEIRAELEIQFNDSPLRDYLRSFDLEMIAVAKELVRKWGKRQSSH